ncbi:hypothetical protein A2130_03795 [Candidatus Woesebacteria bacterium GWC2_33_12]|uniref:Glycosyl transferase, group 1 n=1 Tax=Candidatus Woesebacteria bacterium GW2011_GWB1_33_22 TaxID=1618566 RepID=A0A0G0C2T8_9BACT|nr:MAG: hypothetical protein UR29_C0001G0080 [Candidatus Woesebacteria bacterium GW2011_GWC2_33_12]KKP42710.1 MAG: hypothetical protein UR33_C0001G0071 [Candidatus Woesebacteria bacterium GW2011_GWA2_33_20]KKP45515.1 MAG: hypothetical protein UR35_C0001G0112 [Candidatus Woesebacteria bacterium GW2011_GWB1_33_22]KKP47387.1 MAG: hypothetical protein UR37_C0001G0080 [Microgenomates group bacterium GW2011_GWC1_33_28]KKP51133.1 MAG: hypothetical protein UR41_C0001G0080 [Candidatus Woesebacteria bact
MKILIDARLWGPKNTGNGRYTKELIENLAKIDLKNNYIILLRKDNFDKVILPNNFQKVLADFKHYSFEEQFKLPLLINKYKPNLVHFPHFNVPIFYFGKFVVTIHDLIMHKFTGGEATTRKFPIYQIWRIGYYLSFTKAVFGSVKIIVPSNLVKTELVYYYNIDLNKVEVTYE